MNHKIIQIAVLLLWLWGAFSAAADSPRVQANVPVEITFEAAKPHPNPFMQVTLDVEFTDPAGAKKLVPAFWAGRNQWKVRYASPLVGVHPWRSVCNATDDAGLNGVEGKVEIIANTGTNPLYRHGPIRVAPDQRHFEHADGTPFFWLGDTWWKCLCQRMTWEGFQELTADRRAKGFSVVQIVCGPYPDEKFLASSIENEGGKPYLSNDFTVINPKYFDYADRRIQCLVKAGITPAIVGAWGRSDCDAMQMVGVAGLERHWRYLVARYGAYPAFWIVGGEIPASAGWGQGAWGEVAKYLRAIDPYHHPVTCHGGGRRNEPGDVDVMDFDMVGGNHDQDQAVAPQTLAVFQTAYRMNSPMPVLCGETCYEGHMQQGFGDIQRHIFWMYMLSGAAGHTYGAAGVWPAGVDGDPGNWGAWDGQSYDYTTWKEGMIYPGAAQLGLGKKLLEQYPWWKFEPHPEWAPGCFAAGIPGELVFVYLPRRNIYNWSGPEVKELDPTIDWHAYFFDPATGRTFDQGIIRATATDKSAPRVSFKKNVPSPQDWVLVLERVKSGNEK